MNGVLAFELPLGHQYHREPFVFRSLAVVSKEESVGSRLGGIRPVARFGIVDKQVAGPRGRNQVVERFRRAHFGLVGPEIDRSHQPAGHHRPLMGRIQRGKKADGRGVFLVPPRIVEVGSVTADNTALADSQNHETVLLAVQEGDNLVVIQVFQKPRKRLAILLQRADHRLRELYQNRRIAQRLEHFGNAELLRFAMQLAKGPFLVGTQVYAIYDKEGAFQVKAEGRLVIIRRLDKAQADVWRPRRHRRPGLAIAFFGHQRIFGKARLF